VERWKYLSATVTGDMLRAVEQLTSTTDPEAAHGTKTITAVCLMFLLGPAAGGFVTVSLSASSFVVPIGLLMSALALLPIPLSPIPDLSHLSEPCVFASRHSFSEAQGARGD
jgi:uncharacterized membrane protein YoaK (UPF0700 family)